MKNVFVLLCLMQVSLFAGTGPESQRIKQEFTDNGEALINPMMGWMAMFYSNSTTRYPTSEASDTLDYFPGCSTVYLRLDWADIEPQEGKFEWSVVDTPAQRWIAKGKKVALRFCTSNTGSARYATPQWVQQAGAKMVPCVRNNFESMEPVFDDPVFLKKLENFLAAAGQRYNGNPNIAFIDVGTFGTWGEGHTLLSTKLAQPENERQARIHAELHLKYFSNTLLCISDDVIGHNAPGTDFPLLKELRSKGITFRDDSIMTCKAGWYHDGLARQYWPNQPVIVEHEHLELALSRGDWSNARLLEAVEKYHASYLSIHSWADFELETCKEVIPLINRRLGYRIQVRKLDYPSVIKPGNTFSIGMTLANAGVAPCYPGGFPAFSLKDSKGGLAAVVVDETFSLRQLAIGPADRIPEQNHIANIIINPKGPQLQRGTYDLYISFGDRIGTPQIALPLANDDGMHRYRVGTITVDNIITYNGKANWIWEPLYPHSPDSHAYATRSFELNDVPVLAQLDVSTDDRGEVYLNGKKLAHIDGWNHGRRLNVTTLLHPGKNLLAIKADNQTSYSGILADLTVKDKSGNILSVLSDSQWRASVHPQPGWESDPNVSAAWGTAKVLEPYGRGAWRHGVNLFE